jgi:hypothetical protein
MTNSARETDRPANRNRRPGRKSKSPTNHRRNFDRYTALARTALTSGDAIEAEHYFQHAEHYFRLMSEPAALLR